MRKLISFMHVSLDGFTANQRSEMDWVIVDDNMFDKAKERTDQADTALYGRKTWEMMEDYWPTAGEKPDASKHDKEHSEWYNKVEKIVISKSLKKTDSPKTSIISTDIPGEIRKLKQKSGKEIVIFGSPSVVQLLSSENLIDDYWIFLDPVLIGQGIPLFKGIREPVTLNCVESNLYPSGVVCIHYQRIE